MARPKISVLSLSASGSGGLSKTVRKIRGSTTEQSDQILSKRVSGILQKVRDEGDEALIELSKRFDGVSFGKSSDIQVTSAEIKQAYSKLSTAQVGAIRTAYTQIRWLARNQMKRYGKKTYKTPLGFSVRESFGPLSRIGGYVPGGLAAYPSTVMMICAPAQEAGVKDIVLATPPGRDGSVNEAVLVAADVCGVRQVLKLGGAQAIGALAFGTESIRKVDLIAGPGNQYVTEAKKQVASQGLASIDIPAGPTELLIIADGSANPNYVSEDLISQAEHGNRTLCGVVSDSVALLDGVKKLVETEASGRDRADKIRQAVLFRVKVPSISDATKFAQEFAPEHLEVMVSRKIRAQVESSLTRSGLVLVGDYTPCSSTDYIVGTNHILPTGGYASRSAGVSVETFLKRVTTVTGAKKSLYMATKPLSTLANLESLPNHGLAAMARFKG